MISVDFQTKAWGSLISEFSGLTSLSTGQVVTRIAKGVTRRMMMAVPPFGPGAGLKKSSVQKLIGERAVRRDVALMFPRANNFPPIKAETPLGLRLKELLQLGEYTKATQIARAAKTVSDDYFSGFAPSIQRSWHVARRDLYIGNKNVKKRARIKSRAWYITKEASRVAYINAEVKSVGKAKSGFNRAMIRLKVKPPAWVARHNEPGIFQGIKNKNKPEIVVGNAVPYVQYITEKSPLLRDMGGHYYEMMRKELTNYYKRVASGSTTISKLREKVLQDSSFTAKMVEADSSDRDVEFYSR
jgi:hypothetical protein